MAMSDSVQKLKDKKQELLLQTKKVEELKQKNQIQNVHDIYGDGNPSALFPIVLNRLDYLLDSSDMSSFTPESIRRKRAFNSLVHKIGPAFLQTKQIFEDRDELMQVPKGTHQDVVLPDTPVIYVANHKFRDDILGTVLAADRHAYVMFASLPHFFNTVDGFLLAGNGVVLMNRKVKESKQASVVKAEEVIKNGCDLIIYPEGVWNKSPNQLVLPLWSGVYRIAKATGAKIVPIVHYINDPTYTIPKKDNAFHTVVDDIIDVSDLTEEEALDKIRSCFATWTYLMMEKYGQTTREEVLRGFHDSQAAWAEQLRRRVATAGKYDFEIETTADFRPKGIVTPYEVFSPIANMPITSKNEEDVKAAKKLIKELERNNFQHRF